VITSSQTNSLVLKILVSGGLAYVAIAAPARAADTPATGTVLQEVTVTASKRGEESAQDLPEAIQAISGAQLQSKGAVEFSDFAASVPSLSYNDLGPGDKKYVIRGINSTGAATVGVYYDEAVITASNSNDGGGRNADIRLFDLDRIEVLKGPQGTLYGASSMSGTIRYITRKPVFDKLEGYVQGEYSDTSQGGTNYSVNGAINLPIIDGRMALRVTGWNVDNSGFIDSVRIPAGPIDNSNTEVARGGRVTLRWQPTDNLNLIATSTTQTVHAGGSSRYTPSGVMSFGDTAAGYPPIPGGDLVNTDLTVSPWDEKIGVFGLTGEYTMAHGTLTATSNYFDRKIDYAFDSSPILFFFGVPIPALTLQPQERRVISSEVRYASKLDGPINFVAGGYLQDEKNDFKVQVVKSNVFGVVNGPFSPLDADDALQNPDGNTFFGRFDNNKVKQYAFFGEVNYNITDKLTAVGGVRYFHSRQDSQQDTLHPFGGFGPNIPIGIQETAGSDKKTTFKLNLSYKFNPQALVYATASQGFRAGGRNSADLPFASDIPPGFGPDSLWNFEIGEKSEFLDGRLRLNAALYQIRWTDIQVQGVDNTGAFVFITNAGKARVDGFEVEANAVLAPGLQFDVGAAYTNAKLTEDQPIIPNNPNLGKNGDRLPKVPKLQFNAALDYSVAVGNSANLGLRADVGYRGATDTQFNTASPFNVPLDSYAVVNLRAKLDWNDWTVSLFAKNAFDERAEVDAISSDQDPLARLTLRPRTIGVSLNRKF